jgi:two-component system, chemotaxis family, sensor kinase CheA
MATELLKEEIRKQDLLGAIEEGVLFLHENLEIADEYSDSLEKIIDQEIKTGQSFLSLFEKRVPENITNNTLEFLSLMFKEDLDEETVNELNPLNAVEFHFENRWGLWTSSKYLSFKFKRLRRDDKIAGLIITVSDITKQISLSKKLEEIENDTNKQMEWLVSMLHVEPPLLREFLDVSEIEMQSIDKELKETRETQDYNTVFNKILRTVHQLISNASLLKLNFFISKIKQFEHLIKNIQNKEEKSSGDFVPIVIQLGEIRRMLQDMKVLMNRFKHFTESVRPKRKFEDGLIIRAIDNLVQNLSQDLGKQVEFDYKQFNSSSIPYAYQQIVREFLIILVRFSILYCFEKPDERRSANKNPVGILEIETFTEGRIFGFRLRHDGRLIRIERLLQKSIETTEAELVSDKQTVQDQLGTEVIRLLFMPTTATSSLTEAEYSQEIFNDMEMVKKKLKMHRGKIKITFTSENYCEYTISLPQK